MFLSVCLCGCILERKRGMQVRREVHMLGKRENQREGKGEKRSTERERERRKERMCERRREEEESVCVWDRETSLSGSAKCPCQGHFRSFF